MQLRERRRAYVRRREALQRVQAAAGDLEQRIAEVQAQEQHLDEARARIDALAADATAAACRPVALASEPPLTRQRRQVAA